MDNSATLADKTKALVEALEWYGEQTRLCRLIHSEGEAGRNNLAADGGSRAKSALAAFKEPDLEWEYLLVSWGVFSLGMKDVDLPIGGGEAIAVRHNGTTISKSAYNALRELTKVPKGREWWLDVEDGIIWKTDGPGRVKVREVTHDK